VAFYNSFSEFLRTQIQQPPLIWAHLETGRFWACGWAYRDKNFRHSHVHKWVWPTVLSPKAAKSISTVHNSHW